MLNMFSQKVEAVIVVDIASSLKLLDLRLKPEAGVSALKIMPLPKEKKEEAIVKALADFIRENKISHKNALIGFSSGSLLIKRMQLPAIPEAELLEAVRWKLKEEASFDLGSAVLDFSLIGERTKEDGSKALDCMCVAAKTEEVRPLVMLLKQAGLTCLGVAPVAFGYAGLGDRYLPIQLSEAAGFLHIEEDKSFIAIQRQGKIEFYRQLPASVDKFRESLSGTLATEQGMVNLSAEEIDGVLFKQGIGSATSGANVQVLAMLRMALERLAQEIRRSLNYYETQFQGGNVKRIFVSGSGSGIPGLDRFLAAESGLSIENISLAGKIKAAKGVDLDSLSRSSCDLGLGLERGRSINLLPQEFRSEKIEKLQKVSLRWVGLAAFLALAVSYIFSLAGVAAFQKRMESAQLYLNVLSEVSTTKARADALNSFIAGMRKSEPELGRLLKKLSVLAPKEMLLDNFNLHCDDKMIILTGSVASGLVNPDVILTKFMQDVESSSSFAEATLSSVEKSKDGEIDTVRFKMSISLP